VVRGVPRPTGRGWNAGLPLALLVLGHWLLGLGFNFITPVFEGPDEPNHFLFIRYLQLYHRLPVQGAERDAVRAHHPPAYFALGAVLIAWSPPGSSADFSGLGLQLNPRYYFRFDDPEPDSKSIFLHHGPDERWPYHGQPLVVRVARLLSLAFSTLAIVLTYWAAALVRPGERALPLLAAGLVALNPMVGFMAGVVQNDTAALAAGAAVVLALSRAIRPRGSFRDWLAVGVALGLGILFKAGLLAMGPVAGAATVYAAWHTSTDWRGRGRALLASAVGVALPVAVLAGWWLVRNQQLYGDWTGNAAIVALWGPLTTQAQREFLPLAAYSLSTGLLGRFGNGGIIDFPKPVYAAAGLIVLAALAGLHRLRALDESPKWGGRPPQTDPGAPSARVLLSLHALTLSVISASVLVFALRFNGGATGKYLFPAFPSLAILVASGALAWFAPRARGRVAAGLLLLCAAASAYAIFGLLWPSYGPPRRPLPFELNQATPLEGDLGGVARLLGYRLDKTQLRPGDTLKVTLYWLPEAATPDPLTVFVQLFVPDVGVAAQRDLYPGGGTYPTNVWVPGRPFVDTYYLHVPLDAPLAAGTRILVGLYDEASGQRLTATGADAGPPGTDWIEFGALSLTR
jgi:hypothetical protein